MLSPRAIAVAGLGFGALPVAVAGLLPVGQIIPPPTPLAPSIGAGYGEGMRRSTRTISTIDDIDIDLEDEEIVIALLLEIARYELG